MSCSGREKAAQVLCSGLKKDGGATSGGPSNIQVPDMHVVGWGLTALFAQDMTFSTGAHAWQVAVTETVELWKIDLKGSSELLFWVLISAALGAVWGLFLPPADNGVSESFFCSIRVRGNFASYTKSCIYQAAKLFSRNFNRPPHSTNPPSSPYTEPKSSERRQVSWKR